MDQLGRWLMIGGGVLFLLGGAVLLFNKLGLPIGRLPGDIYVEGKNFTFSFPIVTSIIASIVLTVIVNVVIRWLGK